MATDVQPAHPQTGGDADVELSSAHFKISIRPPSTPEISAAQRAALSQPPQTPVPMDLGRAQDPDHLATPAPRTLIVPSTPSRTDYKDTQKGLQSPLSGSVTHKGAIDRQWHCMDQSELSFLLNTDMKVGLTSQQRDEAEAKYGKNLLTPPPKVHWLVKLFLNLTGGFQLMLWAGAVLCFVVFGISGAKDTQTMALAIVLIIVVVTTAIFQSYQEGKSENVMASLQALTPPSCTVLRDGNAVTAEASSLVPGDIVLVRGGEKVPADLRVLEATELKVNNSSLTGENVDIRLGPEPKHAQLYEAKNVARMGCAFTNGKGKCVVFATGDNTFFGGIANATTNTKRPETLLKAEIHRLISIMAKVAIVLGVTFLVLALLSGYAAVEAVVFCIGIIVANVPEGLLPQMTVALTLTALRMQEGGVLVTNLEIIETLGATTVICSDKTGTLTCNRMTVSHLYVDGKIHTTPITIDEKEDDFPAFPAGSVEFQALQRNATLNTDASFLETDKPVLDRSCRGDASETALIKFVEPLRSIEEYRSKFPRVAAIPFNSTNKWMLTICKQPLDISPDALLMMKGAPERLLPLCSSAMLGGERVPLTDELRKKIEAANLFLGKRGERVLGFAHRTLPAAEFPVHGEQVFAFDTESEVHNFPKSDLVFDGLISLLDPPRPTVPKAIADCGKAGVRVFMVTGDHPVTALAISKQVGIVTGPTAEELKERGEDPSTAQAIVVHGTQMEEFQEEDWKRVLDHKEIVFARTMPKQKQDIVKYLNKRSEVVAMTGDGVNDAPALKAANCGVAMGSGAQVAKEAAQIILTTDDFSCIVSAIKEGRLIFENLKKCIAYVLSSNVPEIIPFLVFIAARIPLGLETIMILLIDLGTDLSPAVALAYEEADDTVMSQPPRKPDEHLVGFKLMTVAYGTVGLFETVAGYMGFFWAYYSNGFTLRTLTGSGPNYRDSYHELNDERKTFFRDMCLSNTYYMERNGGALGCIDQEAFASFRHTVLSEAQAAFLLAVVWAQIGNVIARKTTINSVFEKGLFSNKVLNWCLLQEVGLIALLIWVPKLNNVFMLSSITATWAFCTLWVCPLIVLWEEGRKYFIRNYPDGVVAKMTKF